ncbi:hypothetical protein D3C73_1180010 [compost metagenome]
MSSSVQIHAAQTRPVLTISHQVFQSCRYREGEQPSGSRQPAILEVLSAWQSILTVAPPAAYVVLSYRHDIRLLSQGAVKFQVWLAPIARSVPALFLPMYYSAVGAANEGAWFSANC